jgi:hypothetical protein
MQGARRRLWQAVKPTNAGGPAWSFGPFADYRILDFLISGNHINDPHLRSQPRF